MRVCDIKLNLSELLEIEYNQYINGIIDGLKDGFLDKIKNNQSIDFNKEVKGAYAYNYGYYLGYIKMYTMSKL